MDLIESILLFYGQIKILYKMCTLVPLILSLDINFKDTLILFIMFNILLQSQFCVLLKYVYFSVNCEKKNSKIYMFHALYFLCVVMESMFQLCIYQEEANKII